MEYHKVIDRLRGFPIRIFISDYRYALVINLICTVVITFVFGVGELLWENFVFSMCIGTLAFCLLDGFRLLFWGANRYPSWRPFTGLLVVSALFSQYFGTMLANRMLGNIPKALADTSAEGPNLHVFTLLVCGGAVLFFFIRGKIAALEALAAQEKAHAALVERQALQAQLQLLQAQVEPHMLFNTLSNLHGLIGFDPPRAQLMLDQLIRYLRATLSSSRAEITTLGHEFELMDAYLGLMAVRMGPRLTYALHLPPTLGDTALPPMLLQPLIENAIGHGLEPKIDGGRIDVSAALEDGNLILRVVDTGLGLDHADAKPGTRMALANIRGRLFSIYGENAAFALIPNDPSGVCARLTLPLKAP